MNDKYLPVKIFEKRKDYDDRETEPGGGKTTPKWILYGEELDQRVKVLLEDVNTVEAEYGKWKQRESALPLVIKSTIQEKAIAKTHRKRIVEVLESDGKDNVVGVCGNRQLLSIISTDEVTRSV